MNPLTLTEFASKGGKARWKNISKEERRKAMQLLAKLPRKKLSTASKIVS